MNQERNSTFILTAIYNHGYDSPSVTIDRKPEIVMFTIGFCIFMGVLSFLLAIGMEWKYRVLNAAPRLNGIIETKELISNDDSPDYCYQIRLIKQREQLVKVHLMKSQPKDVGDEIIVVCDPKYNLYYSLDIIWIMRVGACMWLMGTALCVTLLVLFLTVPNEGELF